MPIFATIPDRQHRITKSLAVSRLQRGFTLIELLVVLAIAGLLIGLVPVAFGKMQEGSQYRDTVRALVTELRKARQRSVSTGNNVMFSVDLEKRQFGIVGSDRRTVPQSLELKTVAGEIDTSTAGGVASIMFMPDGGSTGGSVEIIRASGAGVRVRVDWLLGQITQELRSP